MEDLSTNSSNSRLDARHAFYVQIIINIFTTLMAIGGIASNIINIYSDQISEVQRSLQHIHPPAKKTEH
jgi:hypothetical protein